MVRDVGCTNSAYNWSEKKKTSVRDDRPSQLQGDCP